MFMYVQAEADHKKAKQDLVRERELERRKKEREEYHAHKEKERQQIRDKYKLPPKGQRASKDHLKPAEATSATSDNKKSCTVS